MATALEEDSEDSVSEVGFQDDISTSEEYVPNSHSSSEESEDSLQLPMVSWKRKKSNRDASSNKSLESPLPKKSSTGDMSYVPLESPLPKKSIIGVESHVPLESQLPRKLSTDGDSGVPLVTNAFQVKSVKEQKSKVLGVDSKIKKNVCYFCNKCVTRISRHLLRHAKEKEIIAIQLEKNTKKRESKLKELRLKGNFRHNLECLERGEGNLIVMRAPNFECCATDFLPCPYCYGFLYHRELIKHTKKCFLRPIDFSVGCPLQFSKLLVMSNFSGSEELKAEILVKMRNDPIKEKVLSDPLILTFGNCQLKRLRACKGEKYSYLSQRLRTLGRLLMECEKNIGLPISLLDLIDPQHFDDIIKSVQEMTLGEGKAKSLGLKIGHLLRKCCSIALCMVIKSGNTEKRKRVEDFLLLLNGEWCDQVSSSLLRELYDRKLNKDTVLPVTSDLVKFSKYIDKTMDQYQDNLNEVVSQDNYFDLAKITLCKLVVFNKRRGGEVSRITEDDFLKRPTWSGKSNEDVYASLSDLEKKLVERLDLIKVRGKRGRHVPIILTSDVVKSMDTLVINRPYVGIKAKNKYFFASSGNKYFRAHDVLHHFAEKSQIKNPAVVTSTNLRKYIATVSQIVSLEKEELEWVADHLGHSIEVHRDFYRLQESTLEMSKVSKLLLAIENGNVNQIAGKKLSDISLEHCFPDDRESEGILLNEDSEFLAEARDTESICDDELAGSQSLEKESMCRPVEELTDSDDCIVAGQEVSSKPRAKKAESSKKYWDLNIKAKALKYFKLFLATKKVPGKLECEKFIQRYSVEQRTWKDVKNLIYNEIKKTKKRETR